MPTARISVKAAIILTALMPIHLCLAADSASSTSPEMYGSLTGDLHTIRPTEPISRGEFLQIIMITSLRVVGDETTAPASCAPLFHDFRQSERYWPSICKAQSSGLVQGYADHFFRPAKIVNLAEAMKVLTTAFDVPIPQYIRAPDHWYDPYFQAGAQIPLYMADPSRPDKPVTRDQTWGLIQYFLNNTGVR